MKSTPIVTAVSQASDAAKAVADISNQLGSGLSAMICFCSSSYDLTILGAELKRTFSCPIIGCTTAGEIIHSHGYIEGSVVALGFASGTLNFEPCLIQPLNGAQGVLLTGNTMQQLQQADTVDFALLLCDGLCGCEEQIIATVQHALGRIPVVGGSAGDGLRFRQSHVYYDGAFHHNAAVLAPCRSTFESQPFQLQHFSPSNRKLVITEALPEQRLVREIDGIPAAKAYAAAIGCTPAELNPERFAAHPLMLRLGGNWFVRSVQQRHRDDSLTFYCAIEEGLVLTVGRAGNLVNDLTADLHRLGNQFSEVQAIIAFDCILRRIDANNHNLLPAVGSALRDYPLVGMSTYGEQCHGIHVNHTMTGVILGGYHD